MACATEKDTETETPPHMFRWGERLGAPQVQIVQKLRVPFHKWISEVLIGELVCVVT